ncbi:MAG TPA: flagellar hook-associated protein FlgL [Syntrophomonadaceae bacterium]|nr:flagellar hook-associated protein FlgL [Syntrophomonadaceae bacterium]
MIRITSNMMINTLKLNMNTNTDKLDKLQNELATSRKINQPSDDPAGLVKSLRLRSDITENDQYISNINDATSLMNTTESALGNLNSVLSRVRELSVKAANGTNDSSALQSIGDEINQLEEQLKTIANSTYGSKYIFAGSNVTEAPYSSSGWTGNSNELQREIGAGVTIPVNTDMKSWFVGPGTSTGGVEPSTNISAATGSKFQIQVDGEAAQTVTLTNVAMDSTGNDIASDMQAAIRSLSTVPGDAYSGVTVSFANGRYVIASGTTGENSSIIVTSAATASDDISSSLKIGSANGGTEISGIFNVLEQIKDAVSSGNSKTVSSLLENIDIKMDDLLTARAVVGAKTNRLELQQSRLESNDTSLTGLLSNVEDADMTEVSIELKTQENVYNATLAAGAQIIQPSLISFLK